MNKNNKRNLENNEETIRAALIYLLYLAIVLLINLIEGINTEMLGITIIHILAYPLAFTIITYLIIDLVKQRKNAKTK